MLGANEMPESVYEIHCHSIPVSRFWSWRFPSSRTAHAIALMECTWTTIFDGSTACIAVSIEAPPCPEGNTTVSAIGSPLEMYAIARDSLTGTKKSSRSAWTSHLPEPLIHNVSSIFTDVL